MKLKPTLLYSLTLVLLLGAGCKGYVASTSIDGNLAPKTIPAQTAAYRKAVPQINKEQLSKVTDATNNFSLKLLAEAMKERPGQNLTLAPLSLAQDFAMLHECAGSHTEATVAKILGVKGLPQEALASFHLAILNDIETDPYEQLKLANGIWLKPRHPFEPKFAEKLAALYGCSVNTLPDNSVKAQEIVNQWASDHTGGVIKELHTEIVSEVCTLFLNALNFEGKWKTEFDPNNTNDDSFIAPSGKVTVRMMHEKKMPFFTSSTDNVLHLEFPFLGDKYRFVAMMPLNSDTCQQSIQKLIKSTFAKSRSMVYGEEDEVWVPQLDLSTDMELKSNIGKLGGNALFSDILDISKLSPNQNGKDDVCRIFSIHQKTVLKLDEKGVKAKALSEIAGADSAKSLTKMRLDHPFLYFVVHQPSGTIVVCGVVNDPTKQ